MSHNYLFWASVFQDDFSPKISALADVLEKRLLPAFEGIESEAEGVSQDAWEAYMSSSGTGDEDPADFAEAAHELGVSHYLLLDGIRGGMINLFAAALYHAFEQQLILFHRKEILHIREQNEPKLLNLRELTKRLKSLGVDLSDFAAWRKIDELRLVANTVKHADGSSARRLHKLRPDLFEPEEFKHEANTAFGFPRVYQPMLGEDLYVTLQDLREYRDSVLRFWQELPVAMQEI